LRLARYAELVGLYDVYMLGDGGNGYVFPDDDLTSFLGEFRALPRLPFRRIPGMPDKIAVRQNGKFFYAVNLSPDPQSLRLKLGAVHQLQRLTTGEAVDFHDGAFTLDLAPYQLLGFRADAVPSFITGGQM
jgi:hypothetical protein